MNKEKEQIIWDSFDHPENDELGKSIRQYCSEDASFKAYFHQARIIHNQLKSASCMKIDQEFSHQMTQNIMVAMAHKKNLDLRPMFIISFLLCMLAFVLYYTQSTLLSNVSSVSNWAVNWSFSSEFWAKYGSDLEKIDMDFNWSFYLILIIPIALMGIDNIAKQYEKSNPLFS
ncbi:MAG: hypothetical protein V3V00_00430 [Saprospiraceae bacterium]